MPTKRTPAQLDALAVEAARLHFEDELANPEIAARLGIEPGEVAGHLRRARRTGLIAIRVDAPTMPALDTVAGRRLEEVSGIRTVVVVKTAEPRGGTSARTPDPPNSPDRELHRQVASGAAQFLWDRIRDHDTIAVGAGRAVRFTVDSIASIAKARPRAFSGLSVLSLTGNPVVRRDPHDLDSDAIASELGGALKVDGAAIHRVNFNYIARNPRSALKSEGSNLMEPTWGQERVPDIAIFGLGVLDSRHHLMARSEDKMVAPVKAALDRLESEVLPACANAVMDVYDTFWVADGGLNPDLARIATDLVEELNSRIVALPRPKLDQAREKVLVAGGAFKYAGILAYLRQRDSIGLHPTVLVTDAATAERLITDLGGRQTAAP